MPAGSRRPTRPSSIASSASARRSIASQARWPARSPPCAPRSRERYDGDASRIWREAKDGKDLQARLLDLPGIGEMKARTILAILGKRLGVDLPGMADVMPKHQTLGDVDSPEALASYQAGKRAYKAELRAQGKRV